MPTKIMLLIALSLGSFWDGFTTVYGTVVTLGDKKIPQIAAGVVFTLIIISLLFVAIYSITIYTY